MEEPGEIAVKGRIQLTNKTSVKYLNIGACWRRPLGRRRFLAGYNVWTKGITYRLNCYRNSEEPLRLTPLAAPCLEIITDTYKAGNQVVAVLSAQGDTTDELIEKANEINPLPPTGRWICSCPPGSRCPWPSAPWQWRRWDIRLFPDRMAGGNGYQYRGQECQESRRWIRSASRQS